MLGAGTANSKVHQRWEKLGVPRKLSKGGFGYFDSMQGELIYGLTLIELISSSCSYADPDMKCCALGQHLSPLLAPSQRPTAPP